MWYCVVQESVGNTSVLDVFSEVTELEEKVYTELKVIFYLFLYSKVSNFLYLNPYNLTFASQRASELAEKMDQITFNIEDGLPDLMTYSQKLMGLYHP